MTEPKNNQQFFPFSQTTAAQLTSELQALLEKVSSDDAPVAETAAVLVSRYSEKHRFYHNLSHINRLLRKAEDFKSQISDYEGLRLAIWFHDAIYEPREPDNEVKSARLAAEHLGRLGVPDMWAAKVEKMILATERHAAAGLDRDGRLFLDLDLSILGAEKEIYQNYSRAIRAEYSHVPWPFYRRARADILRRFLAREFIYYTDEIRRQCEQAARRNIEAEIENLSKSAAAGEEH